jgi:HEAT repeat protein
MDFTEKLHALAANDHPTAKSLTFLSDLSREDRQTLREGWPTITLENRRRIAHVLDELAEDNIELDFRQVCQVLLDDPDSEVRVAAVDGLWEDESPACLARLLALLTDDPDPVVRAAVAVALGRFSYLAELGKLPGDRPTQLRTALLSVARNVSEAVEVRRRAIESLGYFEDDPEVTTEIQRAYDGAGKLPISAVYAMGRNMDPQWTPIVLRELSSPSAEMRYEAARAVGEMADEAHVLALVPLANDDDDTEVRLAAIWALGQLGGRQAAVALIKLKSSDEPAIAEAADEALNELRYAANPLSPV